MQFGPKNGGKRVIAKWHSIGQWIVVNADEMIRQGNEIIALGLIATADLGGVQYPVGERGMGVKVAAIKTAGGGEGGWDHARSVL